MNKTLQHDVDLDNAIFFGQYVMVLTEGKMTGGGLIESYAEFHSRCLKAGAEMTGQIPIKTMEVGGFVNQNRRVDLFEC